MSIIPTGWLLCPWMTVPQQRLHMQQGKSKLALLQKKRGKLKLGASWWRFMMRICQPPLGRAPHTRMSLTRSDLRSKIAHQQAVQAGQGLPVWWDPPQLLLRLVAQVRTPRHTRSPKRLLPTKLLQVLLLCRWLPAQSHLATGLLLCFLFRSLYSG